MSRSEVSFPAINHSACSLVYPQHSQSSRDPALQFAVPSRGFARLISCPKQRASCGMTGLGAQTLTGFLRTYSIPFLAWIMIVNSNSTWFTHQHHWSSICTIESDIKISRYQAAQLLCRSKLAPHSRLAQQEVRVSLSRIILREARNPCRLADNITPSLTKASCRIYRRTTSISLGYLVVCIIMQSLK